MVCFRSSDSAKGGAGGTVAAVAPVSRLWGRAGPGTDAGGSLAGLARRPPAVPVRARVSASGSQRSLLSVASEGRATSRLHHAVTRPPTTRVYPHPLADSGFSLFVSGRFAF